MRILGIDPRLFWVGWMRRSALILDSAGCPMRLNRWRCRVPKGYWEMLSDLARAFDYRIDDDDDDDYSI